MDIHANELVFAVGIGQASEAPQTVGTGETKLNMGYVFYDPNSLVDATNYKVVIGTAGWYTLSLKLKAINNTLADQKKLEAKIKLNGAVLSSGVAKQSGTGPLSAWTETPLELAVGDVVEAFVDTDDASIDIQGSRAATCFYGHYWS